MKQFFSKFADLEAASANILIGFTLATWFLDCFEVAPVLHLFGPEHEVSVVLRLLNCVCYHPVLLADLDLMALRSLPPGLRVTLLINQADLAPKVERALLASARRRFYLANGNQPMDIFGARALHCDSFCSQLGLNVSINPARRQLPRLTEVEERAMADVFQARLLAYRMIQHAQVQESEIEAGAIHSGLADQMRTWCAATPKSSDVRKSIIGAFTQCSDALSAARYEDPKCLVAEAALMFCHRKGAEHFLVRELAEKVNDLLVGRHAGFKLGDRKVGSVLRELSIQAERRTQGYRVKLDQPMRERIHRIAAAYQSLSLRRPEEVRCADCEVEDLKV
jgi:thiol-disulfide isomerase/thioredoxin